MPARRAPSPILGLVLGTCLAAACALPAYEVVSTSSGAGTGGGGGASTSSSSTGGAPAANGSPCAVGAACQNGFCVDGVCCDGPCAVACQACSAALTGGLDGTCAAVTNGATDPRGLCAATAATSCGTDGKCQAGACENWGAATVCVQPACSSGSETTPGQCDGDGACAGSTVVQCGAYVCNGMSCYTSCSSDPQCAAGNHCMGGACVGTGANGSGCNHALGGSDCTSGICATNGVCCGAACPDQGAASCGSNGTCATGTGACQKYPAGTGCLAAGCNGDTADGPSACDGAGACVAGTTTGCAPYLCAAGACTTSCTSDPQCTGGAFCWLGHCGTVTAITAGHHHTCAITSAGAVQCWGLNQYGELGNGGTTNSAVPVAVTGLSSSATAISAGGDYIIQQVEHSCAVVAGAALCWGGNNFGQLGNGMLMMPSLVPVGVTGLSTGVAAISAGDVHTCALTTAGGVQCWGSNTDGELGNNSTAQSLVPVAVLGLSSGVKAIAAAGCTTTPCGFTCALNAAGGVQCWGANSRGGLGNGTTMVSHVPVAVTGLSSGVVAITAHGEHACALTAAGGVQCWGDNNDGQLGNGGMGNSPVPVPVTGLSSGVQAIGAGAVHTCALTTAGGVQCWGFNDHGQLGNNSTTSSPVPVAVTGLSSGVKAIAVGAFHACALTSAGAVQCWGGNMFGELGNNMMVQSAVPVGVVEP